MKITKDIEWLLSYASNTKKNFFLYCLIGLFMVVVWILSPLLVAKQTMLLTTSSWKDLYRLALFIFGIHFFYSFLKYFISYHAQKYIHATYKNLHIDITSNFFQTPLSKISQKNSGYYIERMTNDTIDIADFFINITDDLIDIFIQIGYLITLFLLNKIIFLFYLYFLILLYVIKKGKTKRLIEEEKKKKEAVEQLMNENIETIRNVKEIKSLNLKKYCLKSISKKIDLFNRTNMNHGEVTRFFQFLTNNAQNIFRLLLSSLTIYLIIQGKLNISAALMAINYESDVFYLLQYLEDFATHIKTFELASGRIKEILDDTKEKKETYGLQKIENTTNTLELQNVSFGYQKGKTILKNINLKINAKDHIGIIGPSGSGKSSLFNVITRLYDPEQGIILLNGKNIKEYKENELRNQITIVSQNPNFFHKTILENLKLDQPNLSKEKIIEICKLTQIHDSIMKLPQGYHTILEENTSNLSGGQKQRLAIARALLKDTPILLLDEATSALDNITQEKVLQGIKKVTKNKITITIAHRLSTMESSDKIIIMKNGKIINSGTHQELIKKEKFYQNLYQLEYKNFQEEKKI